MRVTVTIEDYGKSETVTREVPAANAQQLYTLMTAVEKKHGNPNGRWLAHLFSGLAVLALDLAATMYYHALGDTNQALYDAAVQELYAKFIPEVSNAN